MALNRNSNLSEEIRDVFKLQQNVDGQISNIAGQIIPVVDVNPKHSRISNFSTDSFRTASSTGTVYTTPLNREFYLTGISGSFIKDAANDHPTGVAYLCGVMIDGVQKYIAQLATITLTAQSGGYAINFSHPLKIDKNTSIIIPGVTIGVGNFSRTLSIYGFHVDNPRA